ncbi:MAG: GAF domain-containing sensor histidine kinase [Sphingobacteriaceae bacterium]|nr:MAG: GAF domain-containing sensor histidine kinase [Sphingobacteriaceae bacterium]
MGFAAIARVTDDEWVACAVRDEIQFGLMPGSGLELHTTICDEIRQNGNAVIIDNVADDAAFANHHTPAMYGFQSYISMPIVLKNGSFFGTLCSIDPRPARLNTPEVVGMFKLFAELISFHLDGIEQLAKTKAELTEEQQTAELREQFIAILGHDLRNPASAVLNAAQLLLRVSPDERTKRLSSIIQDSAYRMNGLIENILDFARGRLGDGITLQRSTAEPLQNILNQVINEIKIVWPDREIDINFNITEPVSADGKRIAQLFSNLLGNAIAYGDKDAPINIYVSTADGIFNLIVVNKGKKIPDTIMDKLFQPFSRGEVEPRQQGLGLGLYIASQIAVAHGGTLKVESTEEITTFTFSMTVA